jgi:hypothetical protein
VARIAEYRSFSFVSTRAIGLFLMVWMLAATAGAQNTAVSADGRSESATLPDAPLPAASAIVDDKGEMAQAATNNGPRVRRTVRTGHFDMLIDPKEIVPKITVGDKIGMGLKGAVSPFAVIGWVGSATYSEAFNRSPNYGQSGKDYAQRLGAAAARSSSEGIFSTSVMAPILHEDPRYFVMGPGHSGFRRGLYAVSRVLVTKTDDGRRTINYSLLTGNAIGAALTQTYYPSGNRNFGQTASTFGVSLAGSGVKFLFEEFFYKEASIAQLKRKLEEM